MKLAAIAEISKLNDESGNIRFDEIVDWLNTNTKMV